MDSSYIKACLSAYYRFSKQTHIIATEVGKFSSDFLALKNNTLTEVEIKVSKADLNNDFRKPKHNIYEQNASQWTPNYFYFCVPPELVDYAIAKCIDKPYGVMIAKEPKSPCKMYRWFFSREDAERQIKRMQSYLENFEVVSLEEVDDRGRLKLTYWASAYLSFKERVRIVKRAKKMNNNVPARQITAYIISRLASEMSNLRIEFERDKANGTDAKTVSNSD